MASALWLQRAALECDAKHYIGVKKLAVRNKKIKLTGVTQSSLCLAY